MRDSTVPVLAPVPGGEPSDSTLAKVAGLAALGATLPAAVTTLVGGDQGVGGLVFIVALIVLVTLAVFVLAVPSAMTLEEPGPSVVALALSGLGLFTVLLFWSGLPAVLGAAGIVLGRTQLHVPEDRRLALAATRLGAAAIALYVLLSIADLA